MKKQQTITHRSKTVKGVPYLGVASQHHAYVVKIAWTTAAIVMMIAKTAMSLDVIEVEVKSTGIRELKTGKYHVEAGETLYFAASDDHPGYYYITRWNGHHYCCSCPSGGVRGTCHHDTDVAAYVASREAAASQKEAAAEEETRVEYGCHHDKGLDKYEPMYRINGGQWLHFLGEDGEPVSIMGYWVCQQYLRIVRKSSQMEADIWYASLTEVAA